MPLSPAPIQQPLLGLNGVLAMVWVKWFEKVRKEAHRLPSYTVATLPSAGDAGEMIFVSDEAGGAVIAFADGTNWRRVTDRAIVS